MTDHYFESAPADEPFERESFTCEVWGHELRLASGPGVFSRGHLDHATGVLFRETEPPVAGRFLDLGRYGVIGLAIARAVPLSSVIGVEVNDRAIPLANENAKALGWPEGSSPVGPSRCPRTRSSTRSGPTPRSASASRRCTTCC